MKRRIPKFAFVLLTSCSSLAFASCGKGPAQPTGDTYKFYQWIEWETVHDIGYDYDGVILSENYLNVTLNYDGTAVGRYQVNVPSSVAYDTYAGTYTHEGINVVTTWTTLNGEPLGTPSSEYWTLENDVLTTVFEVGTINWTYILHKA